MFFSCSQLVISILCVQWLVCGTYGQTSTATSVTEIIIDVPVDQVIDLEFEPALDAAYTLHIPLSLSRLFILGFASFFELEFQDFLFSGNVIHIEPGEAFRVGSIDLMEFQSFGDTFNQDVFRIFIRGVSPFVLPEETPYIFLKIDEGEAVDVVVDFSSSTASLGSFRGIPVEQSPEIDSLFIEILSLPQEGQLFTIEGQRISVGSSVSIGSGISFQSTSSINAGFEESGSVGTDLLGQELIENCASFPDTLKRCPISFVYRLVFSETRSDIGIFHIFIQPKEVGKAVLVAPATISLDSLIVQNEEVRTTLRGVEVSTEKFNNLGNTGIRITSNSVKLLFEPNQPSNQFPNQRLVELVTISVSSTTEHIVEGAPGLLNEYIDALEVIIAEEEDLPRVSIEVFASEPLNPDVKQEITFETGGTRTKLGGGSIAIICIALLGLVGGATGAVIYKKLKQKPNEEDDSEYNYSEDSELEEEDYIDHYDLTDDELTMTNNDREPFADAAYEPENDFKDPLHDSTRSGY